MSGKALEILSTRMAIVSEKELGNDRFLVTYIPMLDVDIIKDLNLDIVKIASKTLDEEKQGLDVVSVAISAAVTAYGRIHISKLKMMVMQMGGNIYYSDTDSLVTDIVLPENMTSPSKLRLLKLEHVVIKGIFNNNKTYWLLVRDKNGGLKVINKALGYSSNSLGFNDHLNLLVGIDVEAKKVLSKIDWLNGYVSIDDDKGVKVKTNSCKGRAKVYDSNKLWIDTRPLLIDEITKIPVIKSVPVSTSKALVVYDPDQSNIYIKFSKLFKNYKYRFKESSFYSYNPALDNLWIYSLGLLVVLFWVASIFLCDESTTDSATCETESILNEMDYEIDKALQDVTQVEILPSECILDDREVESDSDSDSESESYPYTDTAELSIKEEGS